MVNQDKIIEWNVGNRTITIPTSYDSYQNGEMSSYIGKLIELDRELDGALLVLRENFITDEVTSNSTEAVGYWRKSSDVRTAREADELLQKFVRPVLISRDDYLVENPGFSDEAATATDNPAMEWEFVDVYLIINHIQNDFFGHQLLIETKPGDGKVIDLTQMKQTTKLVHLIKMPPTFVKVDGLAKWDDIKPAGKTDTFSDLDTLPVGHTIDYSQTAI